MQSLDQCTPSAYDILITDISARQLGLKFLRSFTILTFLFFHSLNAKISQRGQE